MEESEPDSSDLHFRRNRIWFYMEFIPITLLALGVLLRHQGNDLWTYLVIGGGITTAIIYLLFSTVLLQAQKNSPLEMGLSFASGLLLSLGVASLFAKYLFWDSAELLIRAALYSGLGMVLIVSLFLLLHIRQPKSTRFYRDLLARLFIFIALILSLGI